MKRDSQLKLIGLFLVFFGPMFIAMGLYFNTGSIVRPTTNHGQLLNPVKTLPPLEARDLAKQHLPNDLLSGKWTLLYWDKNQCDLYCEASLFKLRQVRLSLGKNMDRLQTVYLTAGQAAVSLSKTIAKRNPRLIVGQAKQGSVFLSEFSTFEPRQIFIVDPNSNLVMKYGMDSSSKGIFKDLKHLLKVSRIG